jgi:hypothetical protein
MKASGCLIKRGKINDAQRKLSDAQRKLSDAQRKRDSDKRRRRSASAVRLNGLHPVPKTPS